MLSKSSDQSATQTPFVVLLVEDSPIIAMNTEALLLDLGVEQVQTAANVAEALVIIEKTRIDLAILDYNLGEENSLPVAERLSAAAVPIVFASGFDEALDLPASLGDVRLLKKPYSFDDLEQIIRAFPTG